MKTKTDINLSIRWKILFSFLIVLLLPFSLSLMSVPAVYCILIGIVFALALSSYATYRILSAVEHVLNLSNQLKSENRKSNYSRDELSDLIHSFDSFISGLKQSHPNEKKSVDQTQVLEFGSRSIFNASLSSGGPIYGDSILLPEINQTTIVSEKLKGEKAQELFQLVLKSVDEQLAELCDLPEFKEDDKEIIEFQRLLLQDVALKSGVINCLKDNFDLNESIETTFALIISKLEASKNQYIAARSADCYDLKQRLRDTINRLLNPDIEDFYAQVKDKIVITEKIYPTVVISLYRAGVRGIVSAYGTASSHAEILMHSFNIPSVSNISGLPVNMLANRKILIDPIHKRMILDPHDEEIAHSAGHQKEAFVIIKEPIKLYSGEKIKINVTLNNVDIELEKALKHGADGVGLFRSEMSFISRSDIPSEEELFNEYNSITSRFPKQQVTMRMLDIGSDKLAMFQDKREENPSMGQRSMRLLLQRRDLMSRQLRAMLRAAHDHTCILFPMISGWYELEQIQKVIDEIIEEFEKDGLVLAKVKFGIMVEVPSVVERFDQYVQEFDVFNIGSNDLTQYTLATDRNNKNVSQYYKSYHPSILSMIHKICNMGLEFDKTVCLCGEIATNKEFIPLLIGLGVRSFSVNYNAIPELKHYIQKLDMKSCRKIAQTAMQCRSTTDVEALLMPQSRITAFTAESKKLISEK